MTPARPPTLETMGAEAFVSLATFRKSGSAVATPVWVASTPEGLVVTTPAGSHKVKRLRARPDATLAPCSRRGTVQPGAPTVAVRVQIIEPGDTATTGRAVAALATKYGLEYKLVLGLEKLMARFGRHGGGGGRVILLLTAPTG